MQNSRKPAQRVRLTGRGPNASEASTRQCAVCREKQPAVRLLQLGTGVLGQAEKRGRSAYVCIATPCLVGLQDKALGKAFKGPVEKPAADAWLADIHALAQAKVTELIGLARRQGALVPGVERVRESLDPVGVIIVANDAAPRSQRQLAEAQPILFGTMESLGHASGLGAMAAIGIQTGRLSMQAAYWLAVWYESRAREQAGASVNPERIEVA